MWSLQPYADYKRRAKKCEKRFRREFTAMLNNLDTYMEHLQAGVKPQQVTHGFVHSEPHGIVAIDQKGGGSGLKETRLYLFPDEDTQIVHVLTLGDKETQKEDIRCCSEFVLELREKREQENDQE